MLFWQILIGEGTEVKEVYSEQECIPVRCVPPAHKTACTNEGAMCGGVGVCVAGGGGQLAWQGYAWQEGVCVAGGICGRWACMVGGSCHGRGACDQTGGWLHWQWAVLAFRHTWQRGGLMSNTLSNGMPWGACMACRRVVACKLSHHAGCEPVEQNDRRLWKWLPLHSNFVCGR